MNQENVLTTNKVYITGTIVNTKNLHKTENGESVPNIRLSAKGDNYISGSITIEVSEKNNVTVEFFSKEFTKKGTESKMFKEYCNLPNRVGERVTLGQAQFTESRFWGKNDQVMSSNRISARFINSAKDEKENQAVFTFEGYVESPIKEKLNKAKELLFYEMTLAQSNWNGEKPVAIKFIVPSQEASRFETIQRLYEKGLTVSIKGNIQTVQTETIVPAGDTAFGDAEDEVYHNTFTYYVIQTGQQPLLIDDEGAYQPADIKEMAEAYNAEALAIEAGAKESSQQGSSVIKNVKKAGTKRQALV
jgi:hypothetical protein